MNHKEMRGIYNTTFNDKNATPIKTDIELVEDAIIEQVAMYVRGYHNIRKDSGFGAEHIKIHLDNNADGAITLEELLNLGNLLREYIKIFKEPLLETGGRKIYEWENNKNIRFRCVVDKARGEGLDVPLSSSKDIIITFYSDRNLNEKMQFKNPQVVAFYNDRNKLLATQSAVSLENAVSINADSLENPQVEIKKSPIKSKPRGRRR